MCPHLPPWAAVAAVTVERKGMGVSEGGGSPSFLQFHPHQLNRLCSYGECGSTLCKCQTLCFVNEAYKDR